jgi:hypothetical protein
VTGRWRGGSGCRGCRRTGGGALAAAGRAALASRGAGGAKCKLTSARLRELETVLDAGPAASGWDEDQCWTLAWIAEVIGARFRADYTLAGGRRPHG